ncbi:MAG: hypothetical protein EOO04_38460 [Chitinophagaceae bacterium]|nr:MAG: hypothetical protein EOO04_38460 [Chitinophagaceae bacterium]
MRSARLSSFMSVGTRFSALGGVLMTAESPVKVSSYDKIGLTCLSNIENQFLLETFFAPPGAFSVTINGWGQDHSEKMKRYEYMAQAGIMIGTASNGKLQWKKDKGAVTIQLKLTAEELAVVKEGMKKLAEIFLAGGAKVVYPGTIRPLTIRNTSELSLLDTHVRSQSDILYGSAHPQGGNPMSDDPAIGVIDSRFKVYGFSNLSIVDASIFPANIWANCQATVMSMARVAADYIMQ